MIILFLFLNFRTTWTVWSQTGGDTAKQSDQRTQRSRDLQSRSSEKRTRVLLQNSRPASIPQISECPRNAKNFLLEIRKPRPSTTYYWKTFCVIWGLSAAPLDGACVVLAQILHYKFAQVDLPYFLRLVRKRYTNLVNHFTYISLIKLIKNARILSFF